MGDAETVEFDEPLADQRERERDREREPDEAAPRPGLHEPPASDHAEHMELAEASPLRPTWAAAILVGLDALLWFGLVVGAVAAVVSERPFNLYFGAAAVVCLLFAASLTALLVNGRRRTVARIARARFDVTRQVSAHEVIQGDVVKVRLDASRCSWPEGLTVRLREAPVPGFETGRPVVLDRPEVRDYAARAQRRGRQALRGVEVLMRDEVGLWEHTRTYDLPDFVEVRPGLPALQLRNMLTARAAFPDGAPKALVNLFREVDHETSRDFAPGDRMKDVDWKRMSATGRMMVRETQNESLDVGLVLLDAGASMRLVEEGRRNLDAALETASEIIDEAARRNHQVGLIAFDEQRILEEVRPSRARSLPVEVQAAFDRLADRTGARRQEAEGEPEPLAVRLQRVLRGMVGSRMGILLLTDLETVDESIVQTLARLGGSGSKVGALVLPQPSLAAKKYAYRVHGVRPPQGYRGTVHRRELREVLAVQGIETMELVPA